MNMDTEDGLTPLQRWYVNELNHLGEYGKAAKYKVDIFSISAAKSAIVEVQLDGDVNNIFNPDTPKRVKDEWNELGSRSIKLTEEARIAYENLGSPELDQKEELPEFIRDDIGRWEAVKKKVSAGWYQDSVGELYHYDGVIWDNVPKVKIDDLEFLGG